MLIHIVAAVAAAAVAAVAAALFMCYAAKMPKITNKHSMILYK